MLSPRMTFLLRGRNFASNKSINAISLFLLRKYISFELKSILKPELSEKLGISDMKFSVNKDNRLDAISIYCSFVIDGKVMGVKSAFAIMDNGMDILIDKIAMYPIILEEAIKLYKSKLEFIEELKDSCFIMSESSNIVEMQWGNDIVLRTFAKIIRGETSYFVGLSSDGLEFDKFYDVYDFLDMHPLFFSRVKYKNTFVNNLKSLMEENLN